MTTSRRRQGLAVVGVVIAIISGASGCDSGGRHRPASAPTSRPHVGSTVENGPSTTVGVITGAAPAGAPFSGFERVRVTIVGPDGKTRTPCFVLARTANTRAQGLMHVEAGQLAGYAGMLFDFGSEARESFFMKDTVLPLSIVWLGPDGRRVSSADMTPCPAGQPCPTYPARGPYRFAIEVPQGQLPALGLNDPRSVSVGGSCPA